MTKTHTLGDLVGLGLTTADALADALGYERWYIQRIIDGDQEVSKAVADAVARLTGTKPVLASKTEFRFERRA